MPINLSTQDIEMLQGRYSSLINYQSEDSMALIDPASYADANGDSLLHIAAQRDDLDSVLIMIAAGFDVGALGDMDNTALHYAYKVKNARMIAALTAAGARDDVTNLFGKLPEEN